MKQQYVLRTTPQVHQHESIHHIFTRQQGGKWPFFLFIYSSVKATSYAIIDRGRARVDQTTTRTKMATRTTVKMHKRQGESESIGLKVDRA